MCNMISDSYCVFREINKNTTINISILSSYITIYRLHTTFISCNISCLLLSGNHISGYITYCASTVDVSIFVPTYISYCHIQK